MLADLIAELEAKLRDSEAALATKASSPDAKLDMKEQQTSPGQPTNSMTLEVQKLDSLEPQPTKQASRRPLGLCQSAVRATYNQDQASMSKAASDSKSQLTSSAIEKENTEGGPKAGKATRRLIGKRNLLVAGGQM